MVAQADDKVMNKAVFILKRMSADEKTREIARVREKALHDEASYMETARIEGRAEGRAEERRELLAQLRALGVDETKLSQAVSNLQN